ncbi:MAG: 6,7-dimethyl-8-ribityllumazine synthase [Phycisphaerales bacterium]|nr:6,7-dimethyl-8-ribityllumazine synthase [Phycisphaerales bacterium]MBT7171036.1 6,7-dimethyl-8-ribityllumazine synthase [Phycisphaerales bacterium]
MTTYQGQLVAPMGARFAIVVGRFNEFITSKLLGGAQDALLRHGVDEENIDIYWSPGAFEIPLVAQRVAATLQYDAVICLGAVIRGGTDHYGYVCSEVSKGIAQVQMEYSIPVSFGVLTCDTVDQAVDRAGTKSGNKGSEAAVAALEMVSLFDAMPEEEFEIPFDDYDESFDIDDEGDDSDEALDQESE